MRHRYGWAWYANPRSGNFSKVRRVKFPFGLSVQSIFGTGACQRSGQVSAYWIGIRMSVAEICAMTVPSLYSTIA